jgi:hypothetical protein
MTETRVDLKHLLEDIRDSYPISTEEAILSELIANSLDSGCSTIDITVEPEQHRLTFVDNGVGMTPKQFEQYHDIASTTKVRGRGIGFAGVGAKLALLVCREVLTEAKRPRRCQASRWWLESSYRAPWEELASLGIVSGEKGTGVRLNLRAGAAPMLVSADAVDETIRRYFHPLLDDEFAKVLGHIYPAGVQVSINGERVKVPKIEKKAAQYFVVRRGRHGKLMGIGFMAKTARALPEAQRGLAISTFGKVIKRGWDWLGITPRNPAVITGIVEVPELVHCLTTNKCDFMRDPNSLKKYYKYRKAIQDVVASVLEDLGERREPEAKPDRTIQRLQREIDSVVAEILPDFPELAPLFGKRRGLAEPGLASDQNDIVAGHVEGSEVRASEEGEKGEGQRIEPAINAMLEDSPLGHIGADEQLARPHEVRRRRPGLMIGFDDETGGGDMAWLRGSTLYVNALHPAYRRVRDTVNVNLYITFVVATTLAAHLEAERPPLELMQRFMAAWGEME